MTRISVAVRKPPGCDFSVSTARPLHWPPPLTLATVLNCIGIGFQRGIHGNWQLLTNNGTGAPILTDMGASFAVATGGVLTLYIAAAPNASSVWVRVINQITGAVFEQEIIADLPANTQFLLLHLPKLKQTTLEPKDSHYERG